MQEDCADNIICSQSSPVANFVDVETAEEQMCDGEDKLKELLIQLGEYLEDIYIWRKKHKAHRVAHWAGSIPQHFPLLLLYRGMNVKDILKSSSFGNPSGLYNTVLQKGQMCKYLSRDAIFLVGLGDKLVTATPEVNSKKVDIHPDILSQQNKMKFMSGDESESMEMWISTYEYRFNDNKASKDLSTILDRCRFYKQASGMKYIEYDYDHMFPETKFNLLNKWDSLKERLNKIYKDHIKDKNYADLFRSLDSSIDEKELDKSCARSCIRVRNPPGGKSSGFW